MKKFIKFMILEISTFVIMGLITLVEITNFNLFETFFMFIKTPCSWFVGFSLAYAASNLLQKSIFSFFKKKTKEEERQKGDYFIGFLITIIITSLITPFIKEGASSFFGVFFLYFHVILLQCIILLYFLFKIKEDYEISGKYFLTSELIVFFYTLVIISSPI
jgi:heme/copper-type cytochrome/quinol oxidase subunit 4